MKDKNMNIKCVFALIWLLPVVKGRGGRGEMTTSTPITAIEPNFGPVAGGTRITLSGSHLNTVTSIRMEPQCVSNCQNYDAITVLLESRSESTAVLISPSSVPYGFTSIQPQPERLQYAICLDIAGNHTLETQLHFEYRTNPIIKNITQRRTFASGGIRITAIGAHLDSVAVPVFYVYRERRVIAGNNLNISYESYNSTALAISSTVMICITPAIYLATNQTLGDVNRNETNIEQLVVDEYTIGFMLDGYARYRRFNETNPTLAMLQVYHNPTIFPTHDTRTFDHTEKDYIDIHGESLTLGAGIEDYSIVIGDEHCDVTEVIDNLVMCKPPKHEPDVIKRGNYKKGQPRLYVICGNERNFAGYMDYAEDYSLFYIIGGVAGAVSLILIIVVVLMCRFMPRAKLPKLMEIDTDKNEVVYDNNITAKEMLARNNVENQPCPSSSSLAFPQIIT